MNRFRRQAIKRSSTNEVNSSTSAGTGTRSFLSDEGILYTFNSEDTAEIKKPNIISRNSSISKSNSIINPMSNSITTSQHQQTIVVTTTTADSMITNKMSLHGHGDGEQILYDQIAISNEVEGGNGEVTTEEVVEGEEVGMHDEYIQHGDGEELEGQIIEGHVMEDDGGEHTGNQLTLQDSEGNVVYLLGGVGEHNTGLETMEIIDPMHMQHHEPEILQSVSVAENSTVSTLDIPHTPQNSSTASYILLQDEHGNNILLPAESFAGNTQNLSVNAVPVNVNGNHHVPVRQQQRSIKTSNIIRQQQQKHHQQILQQQQQQQLQQLQQQQNPQPPPPQQDIEAKPFRFDFPELETNSDDELHLMPDDTFPIITSPTDKSVNFVTRTFIQQQQQQQQHRNDATETSPVRRQKPIPRTMLIKEENIIKMDNGQFQCAICHKVFHVKSTILLHISRSHGGLSECIKCRKKFQISLRIGDKRLKCLECEAVDQIMEKPSENDEDKALMSMSHPPLQQEQEQEQIQEQIVYTTTTTTTPSVANTINIKTTPITTTSASALTSPPAKQIVIVKQKQNPSEPRKQNIIIIPSSMITSSSASASTPLVVPNTNTATNMITNLHNVTVPASSITPTEVVVEKITCDVENCSRKFLNKFNCVKHKLMSHTSAGTHTRPFVCEWCQEEFKFKNGLITHIQIHENDSATFDCTVCGKSFKKETFLNNHRKTHSILDPAATAKMIGENVNQTLERRNASPFGKSYPSKNPQLKAQQDNEEVFCPVCDDIFPNSQALDKHKVVHSSPETSNSGFSMKCSNCLDIIESVEKWTLHKKTCYKSLSTYEFSAQEFSEEGEDSKSVKSGSESPKKENPDKYLPVKKRGLPKFDLTSELSPPPPIESIVTVTTTEESPSPTSPQGKKRPGRKNEGDDESTKVVPVAKSVKSTNKTVSPKPKLTKQQLKVQKQQEKLKEKKDKLKEKQEEKLKEKESEKQQKKVQNSKLGGRPKRNQIPEPEVSPAPVVVSPREEKGKKKTNKNDSIESIERRNSSSFGAEDDDGTRRRSGRARKIPVKLLPEPDLLPARRRNKSETMADQGKKKSPAAVGKNKKATSKANTSTGSDGPSPNKKTRGKGHKFKSDTVMLVAVGDDDYDEDLSENDLEEGEIGLMEGEMADQMIIMKSSDIPSFKSVDDLNVEEDQINNDLIETQEINLNDLEMMEMDSQQEVKLIMVPNSNKSSVEEKRLQQQQQQQQMTSKLVDTKKVEKSFFEIFKQVKKNNNQNQQQAGEKQKSEES